MRKHDIEERFARLEDLAEAYGLGKQPVYVAGSAALLLQGHLSATRATEDIDLMFCPPELEPFIALLDMNDDVNTFEWQFPSGWQEGAVGIPLDTFDIEVYALSVPMSCSQSSFPGEISIYRISRDSMPRAQSIGIPCRGSHTIPSSCRSICLPRSMRTFSRGCQGFSEGRATMSRISLREWSRRELLELTGLRRLGMPAIASEAGRSPRIRERALIYAVEAGAADRLMSFADSPCVEEWGAVMDILDGKAFSDADAETVRRLPLRYAKAIGSWSANARRSETNRAVKSAIARRCREMVASGEATQAEIVAATGVDKGNLSAFIAGDLPRLSLEAASSVMRFLHKGA